MEPFINLSKEDFISALQTNPKNVIVDVRNPDEFQLGHFDSAVLVPFDHPDFIAKMSDFDPNGEYFVYCKSGARGSKACLMLRSMGFQGKIYHLDGGFESLKS